MKRGEFYRVSLGSKIDTKKQRVYVVVSRQELIDSTYSTLISEEKLCQLQESLSIALGIEE